MCAVCVLCVLCVLCVCVVRVWCLSCAFVARVVCVCVRVVWVVWVVFVSFVSGVWRVRGRSRKGAGSIPEDSRKGTMKLRVAVGLRFPLGGPTSPQSASLVFGRPARTCQCPWPKRVFFVHSCQERERMRERDNES